jgi:hypothetical protein
LSPLLAFSNTRPTTPLPNTSLVFPSPLDSRNRAVTPTPSATTYRRAEAEESQGSGTEIGLLSSMVKTWKTLRLPNTVLNLPSRIAKTEEAILSENIEIK